MPSPGRTPNKTASYKRNREIMGKRTSRPVDLPTAEQLATERRRLRYKSKYSRTLRSTVAILVVVAALAVLIATLWMPVLRIYGSSMSPTLQDGQIVVSIKSSRFEPGDIAAFYHGNKLLIKRYLAGPGQWVDIDENGNVFVDRVAAGRTVSYGKGLRPNQHRTAVSGAGRAIFPDGRQPRRIR